MSECNLQLGVAHAGALMQPETKTAMAGCWALSRAGRELTRVATVLLDSVLITLSLKVTAAVNSVTMPLAQFSVSRASASLKGGSHFGGSVATKREARSIQL